MRGAGSSDGPASGLLPASSLLMEEELTQFIGSSGHLTALDTARA